MALSFLKAPTAQVMLPTVVGDSPYLCCRNTPTFYLLEFMQSDGSFVAVDSSVHPYILPWLQKKGRRSGAVSAHVASTGQCYVFDFDTMVQINLATGYKRPLRLQKNMKYLFPNTPDQHTSKPKLKWHKAGNLERMQKAILLKLTQGLAFPEVARRSNVSESGLRKSFKDSFNSQSLFHIPTNALSDWREGQGRPNSQPLYPNKRSPVGSNPLLICPRPKSTKLNRMRKRGLRAILPFKIKS